MANGICGTGVSYTRAAISCLPLVGSGMQLYNFIEIKQELNGLEISRDLSALEAELSMISGSKFYFIKSQWTVAGEIQKERNQLNEKIPLLKKLVVYDACSTISALLSLAGIVSLVALGVLTGPLGWAAVGMVSVAVLLNAYNLYKASQDLEQIANCCADNECIPEKLWPDEDIVKQKSLEFLDLGVIQKKKPQIAAYLDLAIAGNK